MITTSTNIKSNLTTCICLDARPIKRCHILMPDLFNVICGNLDIKNLGTLSLVSREWHLFSFHDNIWKRFENEFGVQAPHIKSKIHHSMTSLDAVFIEIKNNMDGEKYSEKLRSSKTANFFCNFVKVLFEGNIKIIQASGTLTQPKFTLTLRKPRLIHFKDRNFYNILLPTKVSIYFCFKQIYFRDGIVKVNDSFFDWKDHSCERIQNCDNRLEIVSIAKRGYIYNPNDWIYTKQNIVETFLDNARCEELQPVITLS